VDSFPHRRITIVGVGLVGGSIGCALRRSLPDARIIGVDRIAALRQARRKGAITAGHTDLARGLRDAELVVLATPLEPLIAMLPRVARYAPADAVITDVAGVKRPVMEAARQAGLSGRFIGGHPMAGTERRGAANADAELFLNAPWILCPDRSRAALATIRSLVLLLGGNPIITDPRHHDAAVARLSHLPQLLALAVVTVAARDIGPRGLRMAGPAFYGLARLAGSPGSIWKGVLSSNRREVSRSVSALIRELRIMRNDLARGVPDHFRKASRIARRMTPRGFI
jgi:prephenate dehydrogenase